MNELATRSFGAVIRNLGENVDRIVRTELRLAIAEWRAGLDAASEASRFVVAGVACAVLAAAFLLLAIMLSLAQVMPVRFAALVVAAGMGAVAVLLLATGRARLARGLAPLAQEIVPTQESAA